MYLTNHVQNPNKQNSWQIQINKKLGLEMCLLGFFFWIGIFIITLYCRLFLHNKQYKTLYNEQRPHALYFELFPYILVN